MEEIERANDNYDYAGDQLRRVSTAKVITVRQRVDVEIAELTNRIKKLTELKAALDAAPETEKILDAMRRLGI